MSAAGHRDHEPDQDPGRVLFSAPLIEDPDPATPPARTDIADALAAALAGAIEWAGEKASPEGLGPRGERIKEVARDATRLAIGAYEGKLHSASLDGELKAAQIAREYAEARKANAEAVEIEERVAWARLQNAVTVLKAFGAEPKLIRLPDGRLGVAIGDQLAAPLPIASAESVRRIPPSNPPAQG